MTKRIVCLALIFCLVPISGVALAATEEMNKQLLCAITEVIECDSLGECIETLPENIGLPDFILIDLDKKQLTGSREEGARTTRIDAVSEADGRVVFGGLDGGKGWSAVLSGGNRYLNATITVEQTGFVLFGACMPQP